MSQDPLANFGAYQKALEFFDLVVEDMVQVQRHPMCHRLVSQQVAAADSMCANIEEGYGRETRREYVRYLVIARGSAKEAQGRYRRMKHWLPPETIAHRAALCGEVIAILTQSINTMNRGRGKR